MYEDTIRSDLILTSFSAVLDFVRIIGTTFLIEKLNRKATSSEAKTFILLTLLTVTFLTEVCNSRILKNEASLNVISSRSLLAEKSIELTWEPMKNLITNAIVFKGVIGFGSISANYLY